MKTEKHAINVSKLSKDFKTLCDIVGIDKGLEVARSFGGSMVYIPKINRLVLDIKYRAIKKEFTGNNHKELAAKYGYTVTWIRKILDENTKEKGKSE